MSGSLVRTSLGSTTAMTLTPPTPTSCALQQAPAWGTRWDAEPYLRCTHRRAQGGSTRLSAPAGLSRHEQQHPQRHPGHVCEHPGPRKELWRARASAQGNSPPARLSIAGAGGRSVALNHPRAARDDVNARSGFFLCAAHSTSVAAILLICLRLPARSHSSAAHRWPLWLFTCPFLRFLSIPTSSCCFLFNLRPPHALAVPFRRARDCSLQARPFTAIGRLLQLERAVLARRCRR